MTMTMKTTLPTPCRPTTERYLLSSPVAAFGLDAGLEPEPEADRGLVSDLDAAAFDDDEDREDNHLPAALLDECGLSEDDENDWLDAEQEFQRKLGLTCGGHDDW